MIDLKLICLGDHAKVISGYAFKSKDFVDYGVPAIKIGNINIGNVSFESASTQYLSQHFISHIDEKFHVGKGDILLSLTGSHMTQPNSVVGRVARYDHGFISLLNQRSGKIISIDYTVFDKSFLYYLMSTKAIRQEIALLAHGAANQANVSPKDIEKLKLNIPSVSIQKKIAAVLSAYDDLIENNKRRIALLEKMAEEIYREWFVRFRFPGYQKAEFEKGIPKKWVIGSLGDIAEMLMGQSPKSEFYNNQREGLPFHQGVGSYGDRFPVNDTYCSVDGRIANEGSILFSVRAPVGRLNIANTKMIIGRGLAGISHKDDCNSYLYYLLKVAFANEDIIGNGAIFNSVGKNELSGFKIFIPHSNLVEDFEKRISPIDDQIKLLLQAQDNLLKTKNNLLPRLISGKLSVEELDIQFPPSMLDEDVA